ASLLETSLGPVRVQARDDIEGTSVERARHELVLAMSDEQPVNEVERRRAPGPLHRMDIGFDQESRLVGVYAGLGVRDCDEPDIAALVRLADGIERTEGRCFLRPRAQRV